MLEENLVEVCGIRVGYTGTVDDSVALDFGWYYRINKDNKWDKIEHDNQCPCNNVFRHMQHLWPIYALENELGAK